MTTPAKDPAAASGPRVRAALEEDGRVLHLTLCRPPANIIDIALIEELRARLAEARREPRLRVVLLDHDGPNFSYGASVPEHLPGRFELLIPAFHGLLREMVEVNVPLFAAVAGQVLGAGCEVVSVCHRVFAAPDAMLGQPEIKLGVFAPAASAVLPLRIGQAAADELLLTGRSLPAREALAAGLVDEVGERPAEAARGAAREHLFPKSAASLRYAVRAARAGFRRRFLESLAEVEHLYMLELMETPDAVEGLKAFVEKRKPQWSDS